uniref:Uncharacterized protein n=1 Tax=Romanomermis culicivorax TaxID=13658 RepID=A0A915I493_ROMCU
MSTLDKVDFDQNSLDNVVFLALCARQNMMIQVADNDGFLPDNFLFLGSRVGCNCGSPILLPKVVINERFTLGAQFCKCLNGSLDEYLALRSCRKTHNSNVCIRIKNFVEGENPCHALTDVIKEEYCISGSYQYFKLLYGQKMYQSLCHFLSVTPSPLDFGKESDFSIFAEAKISIPSGNKTYSVIIHVTGTPDTTDGGRKPFLEIKLM